MKMLLPSRRIPGSSTRRLAVSPGQIPSGGIPRGALTTAGIGQDGTDFADFGGDIWGGGIDFGDPSIDPSFDPFYDSFDPLGVGVQLPGIGDSTDYSISDIPSEGDFGGFWDVPDYSPELDPESGLPVQVGFPGGTVQTASGTGEGGVAASTASTGFWQNVAKSAWEKLLLPVGVVGVQEAIRRSTGGTATPGAGGTVSPYPSGANQLPGARPFGNLFGSGRILGVPTSTAVPLAIGALVLVMLARRK